MRVPPVVIGTVTVIVFPVLNNPVVLNAYSCCGAAFEPDSRNS